MDDNHNDHQDDYDWDEVTKMNNDNDDYSLFWRLLWWMDDALFFFGLVDLGKWSNDNDDKSFLNSLGEEEGQALGKVTSC